MAQVRINHLDGTSDTIEASSTQEITVQRGDQIQILDATLTNASVDGNNYVVTLVDEDGAAFQVTFVDMFLLLAEGDPTVTLTIGDTVIANAAEAVSAIGTAAGPTGAAEPLGPVRGGGARQAAEEFQADDLGTDEAPRGPLLQDFPRDALPPVEGEFGDREEPAPEPASQSVSATVVEDELQGGSDLDPASIPGSDPLNTSAGGTLSVSDGTVTNISYSGALGAANAPVAAGDEITITASDGSWEFTYNTATNTYSFELLGPLDHADPNQTFGADTLSGVFTATIDGPGGSTSAEIAITVNDDAPTIAADGREVPSLQVDETFFGTDDSGFFSGGFTVNGGADGVASVSYSLSIDNAASGLVDTLSGEDVVLVMDGNDIVGETESGGLEVFRISVDSGTGQVTLDQSRAVVHDPNVDENDVETMGANLISLTATVTDGDGDTDSADLDLGPLLSFVDDGPSISATGAGPALLVDETNLGTDDTESFASAFTSDGGADGDAGTSYALSIEGGNGTNSGLVDTATDNDVFLFLESGVIVGREGTDATDAATGEIVFTLSVDGSGDVTLDQQRAIVHDPNVDENDQETLASNLITLTATITDGDGDTASAPLDIGDQITFEDDGPTGGTSQTLILTNSLSNEGTADLNFVGFGADGDGGHLLTMALGSDGNQTALVEGAAVYGFVNDSLIASQLTSNGVDLVWHDNGDGSWSAVTDDADAFVAFTVDVNPDGTYTVTMSDTVPLDGAFSTFTLDFTQGVTGGNNEQLIFFDSTADDVSPADGIPDGSTIMALAIGTDSDGTTGTVNSSTQGMGVSQGNTIDVNGGVSEELSLYFAEPEDPAGVSGPGDLTFRNQTFATIRLDSLNAGEFAIIVVHIDGTGEDVYFAVQGFGTGASTDEFVTITQGTEGDGSSSGDGSELNPYIVDMNPDGTGTLTVDGEFNHLHFLADVDTDSSYRLVSASGSEETSGFDIDTTFTATSTDGDGDTVDTTFDVTFDSGVELTGTPGDDVLVGDGGEISDQTFFGLGGDDIILGGLGNDTIDGGADNDLIDGGQGADILTGGTGADTFDYNAVADGGDTITSGDFESGTDVIDIADVLVAIGNGTTEGEDWQIVSGDFDGDADDADYQVQVSTDNGGTWDTMVTAHDAVVVSDDVNVIV